MSNDQAELLAGKKPVFLPDGAHWENFSKVAFTETSSGTNYWGSFALTFFNVLVSIVAKIFVTLLAGYAFSLKNWKGKSVLWTILISLLVLPEVALLAGQYYVVTKVNDNIIPLRSNYAGAIAIMVLPFSASIFNILMYRNAFDAIPSRIKEVAMIDGAVGAKYLFKIAIPMVMPTTLTVIILTALASWNAYLWPSINFQNKYQVMSIWLFSAGRDPEGIDDAKLFLNIRLAAAILVTLPMFVAYMFARRRIMNAISRQGSAIKG